MSEQYVKVINGYKIKDENAKNINDKIQLITPKDFGYSGDIFIVKYKDKNILIDTHSEARKNNVLSFLNENDVTKVDFLIISHYHSDHIGNVINLINEGYITSNTRVYLPDYTTLYNQTDTTAYNNIIQAFNNNNIVYSVPTEESTIEIGDLKITFYNSEVSIYQNYTRSNDCSMVCKFEYGDKSILFTGDIVVDAPTRLSKLSSLDKKIDIYKISHHGIENSSYDIPLIKKISPNIILLPAHSSEIKNNNITQSGSLLYASSHNLPIYSCFNNIENIVFNIYKDTISIKEGIRTYKIGSRRYEQNLYVDSSTTNSILNGTQEYPFKDLPQAIALADGNYSKTIIHLADGDYSTGDNTKYNNFINNQNIEIQGNSSDNTLVKIHRPITAYNKSFLILKDLTIYNNNDSFSLYNSDCMISNCVFTNSSQTKTKDYNLFIRQKSKVTIANSTISYSKIGIDSSDSEIYVTGSTFDNLNTGVKLVNSIFKENNNTYTNISTKNLNNTNSTNLNDMNLLIKKDLIFSGDVFNTSEPFNLSKSVENYDCLIIISGVPSTNTLFTCVLLPYYNFADTTIYNIQTLSGIGTLQFTDNGTKGIWDGQNTLRKIYGLNIPSN